MTVGSIYIGREKNSMVGLSTARSYENRWLHSLIFLTDHWVSTYIDQKRR